MKKWLIGAGIALVAIGLVVGGAAFAASKTAVASERVRTYQGGPLMGGGAGAVHRAAIGMGFRGEFHDILIEGLAEGLGLSVDELQSEMADGLDLAEIAAEAGVTETELPAFLADVRSKALAAAVTDGVITQEQADWMLEHPVVMRWLAGMRSGPSDGGRGPMGGWRSGTW